MLKQAMQLVVLLLAVIVCSHSASAYRNGSTGYTQSGCGGSSCHTQDPNTSIVLQGISSNVIYMLPGTSRTFTAVVAHQTKSRAGINISVTDSLGSIAGTLESGTGTKISNNEITHNQPQSMSGSADFSFTWTAPNTAGDFTIRGVGLGANNNFQSSGDEWEYMTPLTIIVADTALQVLAPNGGERFCQGDYTVITWTPVIIKGSVNVEYSSNNGASWYTLATVPGSPGLYLWNFPTNQAISTDYKVRVVSTFNPTMSDASNTKFSMLTTPQIITQPKGDSSCLGGSVTFTVTADNYPGYLYQWRKNNTNIQGATSTSYTITNAQQSDEGNYDVVITGCAPTTSSPAGFLISQPPNVTQQPNDTTVCPGTSATFNCRATGSILTYQWKKNGTNINGATGISFTIPTVNASDTGNYSVTVSGKCSPPQTSNQANLKFTLPPKVVKNPKDTTVCAGTSAQFIVEATGIGLSYQWRKDGKKIDNATGVQFAVPSVTAAELGNYDVVITNACGLTSTSATAFLKTQESIAITSQPHDTSVQTNLTVSFSVAATGSGARFQWMKNSSIRPSDTLSTLTISNVKLSDSGRYSCIVKNTCGQVESSSAKLTVTAPPAGAALALSSSTVDFGCTKVKSSQEKTLSNVVFNGGGQPLNVTDVTIKGADMQDFVIFSGGGSFTLAPNEKRTIILKFIPSTKAAKSATLEFTSNSTVASPKLNLMGKGCLGKIENTTTLEMDSTIVGNSSKEKLLKFCNTGDYVLHVLSASLMGQNVNNFTMTGSTFTNFDLAPDSCITLSITFMPTAIGMRTSEYVVITEDGDTVRFPIQGRGIESVGVDEDAVLSSKISVYPNPSTGAVYFTGSAAAATPVNMRIFDLSGNQIAHETRLATSVGDSSEFQFVWNSTSEIGRMPSGNYTAVFSFGTTQTKIPFLIAR
ncbi:MAG: immunoglobulin domain-containing protein [Ignavibacteria bacterium]|nr:immunoglobulin domain-containing protein [Ignavibacteria bacterium]